MERKQIQYPHMKACWKNNLIVAMFLTLAGVLFAGCKPMQPSSSGKIWVASDMTALTNRTKPFVNRNIVGSEGQVKLFAAGNETVSFQIIVDAPDGDVSNLSIAAQGLHGDANIISAENIHVFHMLPVMVTKYPAWYLRSVPQTPQPAEFYDMLVPIDSPQAGQPYDIKKGNRLGFWVDIHVPRTTRGGNYKGKLIISAGLTSKRALSIELSVYNFVLPDTKPIIAAGGFDHRDILHQFFGNKKNLAPDGLKLKIIRKMMQTAHDHRLAPGRKFRRIRRVTLE